MSEQDDRQRSVRVGDMEREDAVRRLGEHYGAGRLSADEHGERVEQALAARTQADLDTLFEDLPQEAGPAAAGAASTGAEDDGGDRRGAGGPPWMRGARQWTGQQDGPRGGKRGGAGGWPRGFAGLPVPLLVLAAIALVVGIGCAASGHPPMLLILVLGALAFKFTRHRAAEGRS